MDTADRSRGGGAGSLTGGSALATLGLGGEDLVERLVELARHVESGGGKAKLSWIGKVWQVSNRKIRCNS